MVPGLKYGLIAAAGMSAWMLVEYALGLHNSRIGIAYYTSHGTEVILVTVLWRLLHEELYRKNRTWLPVWEGLLHGAVTALVAGMGFYVFLSLYLNFINPDYPDHYLEWLVARLRAGERAEIEIREIARATRWAFGPVGLPVTVFGSDLLVALVASPLLTLWLNWRRKETVHGG
jgi:hypothetical protein